MTLQEKIEVLDGVKDHPNKEKLVFKIGSNWISYSELTDQVLFESRNSLVLSFMDDDMKEELLFQEKPYSEKLHYVYVGQKGLNLLDSMLKQE